MRSRRGSLYVCVGVETAKAAGVEGRAVYCNVTVILLGTNKPPENTARKQGFFEENFPPPGISHSPQPSHSQKARLLHLCRFEDPSAL